MSQGFIATKIIGDAKKSPSLSYTLFASPIEITKILTGYLLLLPKMPSVS